MKTIKRFIVWVNYGLEGWSIFGSSDDWDEAVSIRSEAIDECNIDEEDIILAENKNELVVKPAAKQMTEWHRELEAVLMTLIDRNLNPKKIKKTPKNGCLFNTACVP